MRAYGSITAAFVSCLLVSQAHSADAPSMFPTNPAAMPNVWKYQLTAYGWATSLKGDVGVANLPPSPVDVPFTKLIGHLEGGLMGAFYATNGQWSILTDLMWAKLSDKVVLNTPGGTLVKATQQQLIASGYVGYRLPFGTSDLDLSVLVGLRYTRLTLDLEVQPGFAPLAFQREWERNWMDPLVGLSVKYRANEKWFVNAVADVGGFGVGSEFTAQGFASVGYNWTPSVSTSLGYRVLYVDYRKGRFSYDMTQHGPFMGLAYHF